MSLKKFLRLLANPLVLSLIPALLIIAAFPLNPNKYHADMVSAAALKKEQSVVYCDLTGDGYSEKILLTTEFYGSNILIYLSDGRLINQWNVSGSFDFKYNYQVAVFGDYDGNGKKEMYTFTTVGDSILMHALFDLDEETLRIRDRFIGRTGMAGGLPEVILIPAEMEDLDGDGRKELLFGITAGFSLFPRNIFAYYIEKDSVVMSPESYMYLGHILQHDITGDGIRELILSGSSPGNIPPSQATYHDHSSWLMVLDRNLEFLFEPIEIPGRFGGIYTFTVQQEDSIRLMVLSTSLFQDDSATAYCFDVSGNLLRREAIPGRYLAAYTPHSEAFAQGFFLQAADGSWDAFDLNLNKTKALTVGEFPYFSGQLIDPDGELPVHFYIVLRQRGSILFFDKDLRMLASMENIAASSANPNVSFIHRGKKMPLLSVQLDDDHYILEFRPNAMYYLKYPRYLGIYLLVLLFAWLMQRIQKRQMQRTWDTEKKITELQLSLVKNQLDPHFSLNALHAIFQAAKDNRLDIVEEGLTHFAGMYRNMLTTAGSLRHSLREELSFTEDYLALEKLRFGKRIAYGIFVAPGVDTSLLVPKMLVQVYAENAVKHGLALLDGPGVLEIHVELQGNTLHISVTDNGIGRQAAEEVKKNHEQVYTSTGKGMSIMEDFYRLYARYYHQEIHADITDLYSEEGTPAGTTVSIRLQASP